MRLRPSRDGAANTRRRSLIAADCTLLFLSDAAVAKLILIFCAGVFVYLLVKGWRRHARGAHKPSHLDAGEDMVRCVHCGVNVPRSEALSVQGQHYCCTEHQPRHRSN